MAKRPKNKDLLDALFAEARREAQLRAKGETWNQKAAHLRAMLMVIQATLERDTARRISVRSPRQTGKSTGVMLIVTIRCLEKAGAEWLVIGLTRPSVKRIYWAALKELNKAFELGITFQHQELIATFANGSKISFVGAESMSEIEKFRGGRYDGVVIDECKSFGPRVFSELVHDVLEPALMAKDGQLYVIGTPGDYLAGIDIPHLRRPGSVCCNDPCSIRAEVVPCDQAATRIEESGLHIAIQVPQPHHALTATGIILQY